MVRGPQARCEHARRDRRDVPLRRTAKHRDRERPVVQSGGLADAQRLTPEVGERIGVLRDRGHALGGPGLGDEPHPDGVAQVGAIEPRDGGPGVVPAPAARLQSWDANRRGAPRSRRARPRTRTRSGARWPIPRSIRRGLKSIRRARAGARSRPPTSLGIPRVRQTTFVEPPGSDGDRDVGAGEAVRDLVERSVAAEGHHDVVPALPSLAADLDRVVLGLRGHRLDVVAALQRVDDEVLEPIGDRRRVRVDDDQHALLRRPPPGAVGRRLGAGRCLSRDRPCCHVTASSNCKLSDRLEPNHFSVLDLPHAPFLLEQVDVPEYLAEREEGLCHGDVPP